MNRLKRYRRRWCARRGHPIAANAPICIYERGVDTYVDGQYIDGVEYVVKAYRCAHHG